MAVQRRPVALDLGAGSADAREQYRAVHDAYRTLSDPEARRIYDRSLKMPSLKQRVQSARTVARVQGN